MSTDKMSWKGMWADDIGKYALAGLNWLYTLLGLFPYLPLNRYVA